ncbi:MAG: class I SAM-dependent methyltransferase [Steroidobacteraceae bacterium]
MLRQFGPEDAKRFYDRFGTLQDAQFYERAPLRHLVVASDFEHASAIFELGCGTGRLAAQLLEERLGEGARYLGVDVSSTMISIATRRLARWGSRATVSRVDATGSFPYADSSFDRFVATYVFDIFPDSTIADVLSEAHRLLTKDGKLCVITSTEGVGPISRLMSVAWKGLYEINPILVGGCRPLHMRSRLDDRHWSVAHSEVVTSWGISSEIVVACRV